jgi:CheY-like chemotaxis protein
MGFSSFLNSPKLSEDRRKKYTNIIVDSSNKLLSIVSDILTISTLETKQEVMNIKNFPLNYLILELFDIYKKRIVEKEINYSYTAPLSNDEAEIFGDKDKLSQVLSHLIDNAVKFTKSGKIEFGYDLVEDKLHFYVCDTGIGIEKSQQEVIFGRFQQANKDIQYVYGGTGLGLSIAKGFLEIMGSHIEMESELGEGTSFYFDLPYEPVNKEYLTKTKAKSKKVKPVILIAEDEENNYILMEQHLEEFNYEILYAENGQKAVDMCLANKSIDLILMDIKMPVMDGHTAAVFIKTFRPDIIILAQSAYALEYEREKYGKAFDDFINKPINNVELERKLKMFIH